ncbi:hypothetical protein DYBT9275_03012 [Dyadobacter sp. CECT 9275]|uniref:Tetratricopeptide repeat protein n=1 Tax=Dyadobacter helix TaxID=2822344 RepID=A0A916JFA7_9BACT|nr:hypothetical protein [Dyadobacter sp. CECT 9275]CAG5002962.1 hypothetical protein DYBT9275_03012 [Dyadobacter sp. CECT 9275]
MSIVEKELFSELVKNPALVTVDVIPQLEETTKAFPFFQIAYSLLAKASALNGTLGLDQTKPKAAAYALSRVALQRLVENDTDRFDASELAGELIHALPEETEPQDSADLFIGLAPQDTTPAGQKSDEQKKQQQIIEGFMKKNPKIIRQDNQIEPVAVDLKGRLAESGSGEIETEAFAKILLKQGKIDRAMDLYQKLILKNPEKRNYFAKKLSELHHAEN